MMNIPFLITLISLIVGPAVGEHLDIIDICKQTPNITLWGQLLEQNPALYAVFSSQHDRTLFVPSNKALEDYHLNIGSIFRRDGSDAADAGYDMVIPQMTQEDIKNSPGAKDSNKDSDNNRKDKVHVESGGNKGKKRSLVFPEPQPSQIVVSTGLGTKSNVLFGDIICKQGIVQVVDTVFTTPRIVTETLEKTNRVEFLDSIRAANLVEKYESADQITIFAPINEALNGTLSAAAVESHVIYNGAIYSERFIDGNVFNTCDGFELRITVQGDDTFINGVRIVQKNVMLRNGVVHAIEGSLVDPGYVPPASSATQTAVATGSPAGTGVPTPTPSTVLSSNNTSVNTTTEQFLGSAPTLKAANAWAMLGTLFALMAFVF